MEFKVFVDGIQRVICGLNHETTCRDIVLCLAQATQQFGKFVLIEKWGQNERLLAPNELPIQLLNKWGDLLNEVAFIMRRSDHHQQLQQQRQQLINNEPIYSTNRQIYNNGVLNPINQMNQLNQINQINQMNQMNQLNSKMNNIQPIYYQQTNHLQPNNIIYKQNVIKPNFNSQQELMNQPIYATKYSATQLPQQHSNINLMNMNQLNQLNQINQMNQMDNLNPQYQQQLLHLQPTNMQQNKQLLSVHQHSPHNLQSSPLNQLNHNQMNMMTNQIYAGQMNQLNNQMSQVRQINQINLVPQPQQYSPNFMKMNNNMMGNNLLMNNQLNQINQLTNLNQMNNFQAQQYELLKNNQRPKCPPPYNEAITKSALLQNNSPGKINIFM